MLPATSTFGLSEKIAGEAISFPFALLFCAKEKLTPIATRIGAYVAGASASFVRNQWSQLPPRSHILGGLAVIVIALWIIDEREGVAEENLQIEQEEWKAQQSEEWQASAREEREKRKKRKEQSDAKWQKLADWDPKLSSLNKP